MKLAIYGDGAFGSLEEEDPAGKYYLLRIEYLCKKSGMKPIIETLFGEGEGEFSVWLSAVIRFHHSRGQRHLLHHGGESGQRYLLMGKAVRFRYYPS